MKTKLIILIVILACLLVVSGYYVYDYASQNSLLLSKAANFKCPEVTACPVTSEADQESEISPVSAGPDTLGDYKVADFLDLGPKDLYMLVENENEYEYEALYCGAGGKEVSGDYYLYYGKVNDFTPDKKLALGSLKFDSAQKNLFLVYLNRQTNYVAVVQYNSCNSDIYRVWQIKRDDSFTPVTFDIGIKDQEPLKQIAVSSGRFSLGNDKVTVYTYLGASPGNIADKTYNYSLYQDQARVENIVTNYGDDITGYDYYIPLDLVETSSDKFYDLYSFKLPTEVTLNYQLRKMTPQFQVMLDDDIWFELATANLITYPDGHNDFYKQAEYNGLKYYLYLYHSKYDWQEIFLKSFTVDGNIIFED